MAHETALAFLSYASDDSEFALKLASDLKSAGAAVWIDKLDIEPGHHWDRAVHDALRSCPNVLLVLSPSSVTSENVMDEMSFALDLKKLVIPVLYVTCEIPFRLRRVQYIDARSEYNNAVRRLVQLLARDETAQTERQILVRNQQELTHKKEETESDKAVTPPETEQNARQQEKQAQGSSLKVVKHNDKPPPDQLVRDFADGLGTVFVGAEASDSAGVPRWRELLEDLTGQPAPPKNVSYPDMAQYYENEKGRQALADDLWKLLQKSGNGPTGIHDEIVKLPIRRIFTTNLDTLLETAAIRNRLTPHKITNTDPSVTMSPHQLSIFKLHGDLDQRPSYVITADDYERYASRYPVSVLMMSYEFHTATVLFVGYSFDDFALRMILRDVSAQAGPFRRRHYALLTNPSRSVETDLERRGIQVIPIQCTEENCASAVHAWLQEFASRVAALTRADPSYSDRAEAIDIPSTGLTRFAIPAPSYRTFVGREQRSRELRRHCALRTRGLQLSRDFRGQGRPALRSR